MQVTRVIFFLFIIIPVSRLKITSSENKYDKQTRNIKLPACQACKALVRSFYLEEQKLENAFSSNQSQEHKLQHLHELLTNLCWEDRAKDQCLTLAEKCKDDLKDWWLNVKSEDLDLLNYLCVKKLRYCCPNGHYGPECKPCPGYPHGVCSNNGKCKGNGTRKGNGQCACDVGYSGILCNECAPSYYVSYKDDNKMLCARCHSACEGNCSQAGAKGCVACREGWRLDKFRGCMDINECISKRPPCKRNEFCVNNEGSYSCLACDSSCDTCTGDGPDMCEKCAVGFFPQDNLCVNERLYVSYSDVTRYLTYLGLCFATYIVFQNSPWAASLIGICVAIYVTVSEYMLGTLAQINFMSFFKTMDGLENIWRNDL